MVKPSYEGHQGWRKRSKRIVAVTLVVMASIALPSALLAQDTSRDLDTAMAGFLRVAIPPQSARLVALPFDARDAGLDELFDHQLTGADAPAAADRILFWNPHTQSFTDFYKSFEGSANDGAWLPVTTNRTSSVIAPAPGQGFWIRNNQSETQEVYLAGAVATNEAHEQVIHPLLNVIGSPYSSAVSAPDQESDGHAPARLEPGEGIWFSNRIDEAIVWSVARPYPNCPEPETAARIAKVEYIPHERAVAVTLARPDILPPDQGVVLVYKDLLAGVPFDPCIGWQPAATLPEGFAGSRMVWYDRGGPGRDPVNKVFGRVYRLVAASRTVVAGGSSEATAAASGAAVALPPSAAANEVASGDVTAMDATWYYFSHDETLDPMVERVPGLDVPFVHVDPATEIASFRLLAPPANRLPSDATRRIWFRFARKKFPENRWHIESHRATWERDIVLSATSPFHGIPSSGAVTLSVYRVDWRLPKTKDYTQVWFAPTICFHRFDGDQIDWSILLGARGISQPGETYAWNNWRREPQRLGKNYIGNDFLLGISPRTLRNGGFEGRNRQPASELDGWRTDGYSGLISTEAAYLGRSSLRLSAWDEGVWQELSLPPGQAFVLRCAMMTPRGSNTLSGGRIGIVSVDYYDRWERRLGGRKAILSADHEAGAWHVCEITNRVPPHTRSVNISVYLDGIGEGMVYVDDLALRMLPPGHMSVDEASGSPATGASTSGMARLDRAALHRDSDADGLPDGLEAALATDPTIPDTNAFRRVTNWAATQAVERLGGWIEDDVGLSSTGRRGGLTFDLQIPEPGLYRVEADTYPLAPVSSAVISEWYIDGQLLSRVTQTNTHGHLRPAVLLPWLKAGNYRLTYHWDNAIWGNVQRIAGLSLKKAEPAGFGKNDTSWMTRWLASASAWPERVTSCISPVWIEGAARYPQRVRIADTAVVTDDNTSWFASIPMPHHTTTTVAISWEDGALERSVELAWTPLDPFSVTNLTVPAHAMIRFGVAEGRYQVQSSGSVFDLASGLDAFVPCPAAGDHDVRIVDPAGSLRHRIRLHVVEVEAMEHEPAACWVTQPRQLGVVKGPGIRHEAPASVSLATRDGGVTHEVDNPELHRRMVVSRRLADGRVVALRPVRGFSLSVTEGQDMALVSEDADGTQTLDMTVAMHPVVPGLEFVIDIYAAGVLFEDGSLIRKFTSADFLPDGEYRLRLLRHAGSDSAACHRLRVYQDGVLVGGY